MALAEAQIQAASPELMRKTSALSESAIEDRVLSPGLLKKRPSSAQVSPWSYELAQMLSSPPRKKEAQIESSDLELKKRLSSLGKDDYKEEITEGKDYLITPQDIEHQIRKWYEELPEVQTSDSHAATVQKQPLWSSLVDSEVQTSYIDVPMGNKWRASRMQAEAEAQTEFDLPEDEGGSRSETGIQTQTSLLEVWQARDLAEAQMQTSDLDVDTKEESPPPVVDDPQMQTSLLDIWKAKEQQADFQTQTSVAEHSLPAEQSDRLVQTSFMDIWKAKELENMPQKTPETGSLEPAMEASPPLFRDLEVQTDAWRGKEKSDARMQSALLGRLKAQEQPLLPLQMDAQVQMLSRKIDSQIQTSIPSVEATSEPPLTSQMDTQAKASLLNLWKTKETSETQSQTSWTDFPKSMEEPPVPPPSQIETQVQTSLLDMWKTKELVEAQMQTPWTEVPKLVEERPVPLPSHKDTQVQTSLIDMWKSKELDEAQMQTSLTDVPKLGAEPPAPLPSHKDTQLQTSLIDIWRTKELDEGQMQTSLTDLQKSVEEPPVPLPSHKDGQVQTSLVDVWRTKELTEVEMQTPWADLQKSGVEPPVPSSSRKDSQVQTSHVEICKTKEVVEAQMQTPWSDLPKSMKEPSRSLMDTQVQTSLSDIWRTKELSDAQMQTSWTDLPKAMAEPPIHLQSESPIQPPAPKSVGVLPTQIDMEVQTSSTNIWKTKELIDANIQTSLMDLSQSTEALPLPSRTESSEKPPSTELVDSRAKSPSPAQIGPEKQASLSKMLKMKEPVDVQGQSFEFPMPDVKSTPAYRADPEIQTSKLDIRTPEKIPYAETQSSSTKLPSATGEPVILSQVASPMQLLTPEKVESALLVQDSAQLPMSLLKQWTTREEAELQKQTDNLGLSFENDLALLCEGQMSTTDMPEKEKQEQVSKGKIKSKPPVFTEAQVQTSFVEIPRGKKWRASRLCTEAQVQTSFHDLHGRDRVPALQKMVADHVAAKKIPKGPRRATPVSVHLHVKMSPKRRASLYLE